MVIANTDKHVAPYWNDGINLKLGLNQLGIRNVAEQLFAKLLPGLNNVSSRIRYYSFYCWLINKFYEDKDSVEVNDFNPYLRRAELLLALVNATKDDSQGIPGINYALLQLQNNSDKISLKDGAKFGVGTYWANAGGIFRQYYGASLVEIGLIGANVSYPQLYNIRKEDGFINGKILADSFASTVGQDGETFLNLASKDEVSFEELRNLSDSFNMKVMPTSSQEREWLQELLLQKDSPTIELSASHRKQSIKHVLRYLTNARTSLEATGFSKYMYQEFHRGQKDETIWGWYAYYLDDNWQYQLTRIFNILLSTIKLRSSLWTPIDIVASQLSEKVLIDFNVDNSVTLDVVIAGLTQKKMENDVSDAINNLLWLYKENIGYADESEQHYHDWGIEVENFCDFMKDASANLQTPFVKYVYKLITEDVIFRHYKVSFRKMLQTGLATQKFSIENGNIRFIEDWPTSHTSPRIDTLRNFLIDLCLIKKDGSVTNLGVELLNRMNDEYNREA